MISFEGEIKISKGEIFVYAEADYAVGTDVFDQGKIYLENMWWQAEFPDGEVHNGPDFNTEDGLDADTSIEIDGKVFDILTNQIKERRYE